MKMIGIWPADPSAPAAARVRSSPACARRGADSWFSPELSNSEKRSADENTSTPIDTQNVAEVVGTILASPTAHIGKVYELTGLRSQDMHAMAAEYSAALGRTITYVDVPLEQWRDQELRG
jgi:hypothetical protein